MSEKKDEGQRGLLLGAGARGARVLGMAARMGGRSVLGKLGSVVPGLRGSDGQLADELMRTLGELKGGYMKIGQILSYVDSDLSDEVRRRLQQLCLSGSPMAWEVIERIIREEFGRPAEELFPGISQTPVASASIGQVHRATLSAKQPVAVKVQYPEVSQSLEHDLSGLSKVGSVIGMVTALEPDLVLEEMRQRFQEECDYRKEAYNQETFWLLARRYAGIRVPQVFTERSSARVLCTEWVEGRTFERFLAESSEAQRQEMGLRLFTFVYELLFREGLLNADPHPGNYLFSDDTLVLLDFGCVKRLSVELRDTWKRLLRALSEGDRRAFREAVLQTGFVANERKFDFDYFWGMLSTLYKPLLSHEPFQFTSEFIRHGNKLQNGTDNPNLRITRLPADWVFINRLQWGLNSILVKLGTRFAFRRVLEPLLHEETRPLDEQALRQSAPSASVA